MLQPLDDIAIFSTSTMHAKQLATVTKGEGGLYSYM